MSYRDFLYMHFLSCFSLSMWQHVAVALLFILHIYGRSKRIVYETYIMQRQRSISPHTASQRVVNSYMQPLLFAGA